MTILSHYQEFFNTNITHNQEFYIKYFTQIQYFSSLTINALFNLICNIMSIIVI